jgi:hypothetical protein
MLNERSSTFIRDKPNVSSERMLHKGYCRGSVGKNNLWSWFSRGFTPRRTDWQLTASREVILTLVFDFAVGVRWPPACKDMSPAAEDRSLLEDVTRHGSDDGD